jgi:hypothetical protein
VDGGRGQQLVESRAVHAGQLSVPEDVVLVAEAGDIKVASGQGCQMVDFQTEKKFG